MIFQLFGTHACGCGRWIGDADDHRIGHRILGDQIDALIVAVYCFRGDWRLSDSLDLPVAIDTHHVFLMWSENERLVHCYDGAGCRSGYCWQEVVLLNRHRGRR